MNQTYTQNQTFTITHAKYLASKVAADLKRIQRFYDSPSNDMIEKYEGEITALLKQGYLEKVAYGFKKDGQWIEPTLIYKAEDLQGTQWVDDDPGRVRPGANVTGAFFTSCLSYNSKWFSLPQEEKTQFESTLPLSRTTGSEPTINGYISSDKSYTTARKSLNRSSVKSSL